MEKKDWSVTFSIGVATFFTHPKNIDEAIQSADKLMYASKKKGRNQVHYQEVGEVEDPNILRGEPPKEVHSDCE